MIKFDPNHPEVCNKSINVFGLLNENGYFD